MQTKLIDHLIKVKNLSGAIPAAPSGLKTLKQALQSVPFDVEIPGMSQVLAIERLANGLVDLIREFKSLAALGQFKNILGKLQKEVGDLKLEDIDPERLAGVIKRVMNEEELIQALGGVTALVAGLKTR